MIQNKNKKILTILIALAITLMLPILALNAHAKVFTIQNESVNMFVVNGSSGNIILNPNAGFGNVGIGTANPGEKLVVIGNANISNPTTNAILGIDAAAGTSAIIRFFDGGTQEFQIGKNGNNAFAITETGVSDVITITGGNVGIGRATPNVLLDVGGSIRINASQANFILEDSSSAGSGTEQSQMIFRKNGTNRGSVSFEHSDATLRFEVGDATTADMLITSSGNVGIGTTTPSSKLEVVGNLSVNGSIFFKGQNDTIFMPVYGSDDDLILYLPFNAPNGSTQYDRSPYGNDGILQGGINCNISIGKYGAGCEFASATSSDAYITISDHDSLYSNISMTWEMWAYKKGESSGADVLFQKDDVAGNREYDFSVTDPEILNFRASSDGSTYDTNVNFDTKIKNNTWHHLAVVWDGTTVYGYVNGIRESTTASMTSIKNTASDINLGTFRGVTTQNQWNGTIDEFRIYKRALSSEEIRTQYLRGTQAHGSIVADKFRVVNTTGGRKLELNDSAFAVHTGGSERLKIDSSGNVGIGTTAPNDILEAVGNVRVSGSLNATNINASRFYARNGSVSAPSYTFIEDTDTGIFHNGLSGNNISIVTGGTARMTIDSSGRVGIGTTSPGGILDIDGGTGFLAHLRTASDGNVEIDFRNGPGLAATDRGGWFSYRFGTNYFTWGTKNSAGTEAERMVFTREGNLGIGTTTPAQTLNVLGTLNVTGQSTREGPDLFVTAAGDVGIGTTSPADLLHVSGSSATADVRIRISTTSPIDARAPVLRFTNFGGNFSQIFYTQHNYTAGTTGGNALVITNVANSSIIFHTNDVERMRITALGDVGINTATPNATLDVRGTGIFSTGFVNFTNNTAFNQTLYLVNGNVGIGTTSPTDLLTVSSGKIKIVDTFATLNLTATGGATNNWNIYANNDASGAFVIALNGTGSVFEKMRITNSGNVGIGTTQPAYRFEVTDTGTTTAVNLSGVLYVDASNDRVGINTTNPKATLHVVGFTILQGLINSTDNQPRTIVNFTNSTSGTVCYIDISGNLVCAGTKSAIVATSFDSRKLYAVESPDVRHIDEGRAKLRKGFANVSIDPIFKETIENDYNVYLTPEGKTKALYVDEKAKDYFIVRDTASTNAVFSYIISAYRKGYANNRFESDSEIEIIATVDEETSTTEIEITGSLAEQSAQSSLSSTTEPQTTQETQNTAQSTPETQQNTSSENTSLAISGVQETTTQDNSSLAISGVQETNQTSSQTQQPSNQSSQQTSQPNSVAIPTGNSIKILSNKMTGKIISEVGLETDLSKILDESSTITKGNLGEGQNDSTSSPDAEVENNSTNETTTNQTANNTTSATETEEQDEMTITDTTNKYTNQTSENNVFDISENKFIIYTTDEDEIIKKIKEKTKMDKDTIKKAIKFKKKEPVKEDKEEIEEFEEQPAPSIVQLGYIEKVNGSVIIRLG